MFSRKKQINTEKRKGLKIHLTVTILVSLGLTFINLVSPVEYLWCKWPILGMSIGMLFHGIGVYLLPGSEQD